MTEDSTAARISNPAMEHRRWRNKLLDLDEAYHQVCFALPLVTTSICFYLIPLVSVMFAGHLGELELAGATLANSWATTTGLVVMVGLSGALETLCGQGFGARDYRMLGVHLQASCIVSLPLTIFVAILWFFTEPILISIRQDQQIAKYAALYIKFFIPGLFPYAILQNLLRFMQTQSVVLPLYFFSVIQMVVHVGITYSLVHCTGLRYKGAPLSASISIWMSMLMLVIYVMRGKKFERTWGGFSLESFHYALTSLKLALPSALMVCLEYWAFEILVLMAGVMPNSKDITSLVALCVNTEAIAYMITYGLSAAASTRVSNELGAGDPEKAKKAMAVSLELSVLLALLVILALALGHKVWAGLFTDSHVIIMGFASMTPFLAISIVADSVQGVLSGVARGCGWQHLVVYVNLGTFYMVGITIAGVLGFKLKLYAKGLWIGLICGLSCQTGSLLLLVMLRKQWTQFNISHNTDAVGV